MRGPNTCAPNIWGLGIRLLVSEEGVCASGYRDRRVGGRDPWVLRNEGLGARTPVSGERWGPGRTPGLGLRKEKKSGAWRPEPGERRVLEARLMDPQWNRWKEPFRGRNF